MEGRLNQEKRQAITRITVAGYKSIREEQSIEIRPLTLLAGANSSGKSSIMQPLLLLKQTLEATYDPGPLLLNGPNVKFTSVEQVLARTSPTEPAEAFSVGVWIGDDAFVTHFRPQARRGFGIQRMDYIRTLAYLSSLGRRERITLRENMTHDEILALIPGDIKGLYDAFPNRESVKPALVVVRNRCFLGLELQAKDLKIPFFPQTEEIESNIRHTIHLPGLRGNPERAYPVTAVGSTFPGTFEKYTASVIAQWQTDGDRDHLARLTQDLKQLEINWQVTARRINDTQVELQVGRLARDPEDQVRDLVNIADVGFGVSQTLPVLVALQAAEPGQLVYLEQPEIHLHPRAQAAMAQVLAAAARRGVRVVAETHSALLLLGVQTLVAEGKLSPELVKLHWFTQRADGATEISSCDLDETGAFGDWPQDFGLVELEAESRYLDAVEAHYGDR